MKWGKAYTSWLRQQGIAEDEIGIHLRVATRIIADVGRESVDAADLDAMLKRAEAAGATPAQLGSFRQLGEVFVRFAGEQGPAPAPAPAAAPARAPAPAPVFALAPAEPLGLDLELGDLVPPPPEVTPGIPAATPLDLPLDLEAPALELDLAPSTPRGEASAPAADLELDLDSAPPSAGPTWDAMPPPGPLAAATRRAERTSPTPTAAAASTARRAAPIAIPSATRACPACGGPIALDYGRKTLVIGGGASGLVSVGLGLLFGCLGAASVLLLGAAVGSVAGIALTSQRCTSCKRRVPAEELTDGERAEIRGKRIGLGATSVATGIAGIVLVFVWLAAAGASTGPERPAGDPSTHIEAIGQPRTAVIQNACTAAGYEAQLPRIDAFLVQCAMRCATRTSAPEIDACAQEEASRQRGDHGLTGP